ncbi:rod-binding protein [Tepidibacter formicigenes]|jgi:flagellar protein FlgJ|uniref:Flagellar protein FlgJ n=1 Tax=Tepidibacter formicigenes DSM 15518 TaxID=1123349 RepID=A0A1M6SQS3_9FIRM|nr:rod-binding protein [Tepidibacter formicigenes]SHK47035.1 flagellar protein FlgJ [Tepidibacter formicigenes DSM 15518]
MQVNNRNLDILKSKVKNNKDDKELMKTCKELEAEFVKIMFKEMKKTVPKDSLMQKSSGREIFEDLYTDELANKTSKDSSLGLAKLIYEQFTKTNIKR